MTTVSLTTSATQIDDGTAGSLYIVNTATSDVLITRAQASPNVFRIRGGQNLSVSPEGFAVTAKMTSGTGSIAVTTIAAPTPSGGGAGGVATDPNAVHVTGSETIAGAKTFSSPPVVPTPTASGHATPKAYVDGVAGSGSTPDADGSTKGKIQLAGDLNGSAASPSVAKVSGIAVSGTPSAGQVLTASSSSAAGWSTPAAGTGDATSSAKGVIQLGGGDLAGTASAVTVPALTAKAPLASPTFTGTPAAPTASADTSTTQVATTAFVLGQAGAATPQQDGTAAAGSAARYARQDHVHPSDTTRSPLFEGVSHGTGSTAYTIPAVTTATMHEVTLNSASCVLTFPAAAEGASFTLMLRQDATGGRNVTWPGTIVWQNTGGGAAPTLATGAAKINTLSFACWNAGFWLGYYQGSDA